MLAWGIVIGAFIVMYIFPILDYLIIFKISVFKAVEQYEIQEQYDEKKRFDNEKPMNPIGFRYEPEELIETDEDFEDDDMEFGDISC